MSKLVQMEIRELGAWSIAGKEIKVKMGPENPIPAFWDKCFTDGTFTALEALTDWVLCPDYVGFMTDYQGGDNTFVYIVGMMMKPGCPVPQEGFVSRPVEPSSAAVGWIQGESTPDVCMPAHEYTSRAMEEKGYISEGFSWCMELYNCPRFTTPNAEGQIILDYYIPCKKKQ